MLPMMRHACVLAAMVAAAPAFAEQCWSVEFVPATTTSGGSVNCTTLSGGITIGIPIPGLGTIGYVSNPTRISTSCAQSIVFVPAHHVKIPGTHQVSSSTLPGSIQTYTGCHAADDGAVCDYSTQATSVDDWKVDGPCIEVPPAESTPSPRT